MKKDILEILENDSRISVEEIAQRIGADAKEVFDAMAEMEENNVICAYSTLINWDKTTKEYASAIIEVKVTPQKDMGFEKIAEKIARFDEVKAVYLMSGTYDLLLIIEGKNIKDISYFVYNKLSILDSVLSTGTHFVLKKYKDHGVILEKGSGADERMIISP